MKVKDLVNLLNHAPQDADLEMILYHEMALVSKVRDVYSADTYNLQNVYIPLIGNKVYLSSVIYLDPTLHDHEKFSVVL